MLVTRISWAGFVACWLCGLPAVAQDSFENNDFTIDVVTGPVLASGRVLGMGGAQTALAAGIDGVTANPADYGTRVLWELDWFEWDLTASLLIPGTFARNDFDNDGKSGFTYDDFVFADLGGRVLFGDLGMGVLYGIQTYQVVDDGTPYDITLRTARFGGSYNLFQGQLTLGVGARSAGLDILAANQGALDGRALVSFSGTGIELGVLWRPAQRPWRFGAAFRNAVSSRSIEGGGVVTDDRGVRRVGRFVLPERVYLPWELQAGVVYQFGSRPLNLRWLNPDEERLLLRQQNPHVSEEELTRDLKRRLQARELSVKSLSRSYLLLAADVILYGPTSQGVGVESFLSQTPKRSGEDLTYGIRLGAESEPWPDYIKARAGSYLEPSRFRRSHRAHFTTGFDLKLFTWDVFGILNKTTFRLTASGDIASRYFNWGLSFGTWN